MLEKMTIPKTFLRRGEREQLLSYISPAEVAL
jgi:hypothetical protein